MAQQKIDLKNSTFFPPSPLLIIQDNLFQQFIGQQEEMNGVGRNRVACLVCNSLRVRVTKGVMLWRDGKCSGDIIVSNTVI